MYNHEDTGAALKMEELISELRSLPHFTSDECDVILDLTYKKKIADSLEIITDTLLKIQREVARRK